MSLSRTERGYGSRSSHRTRKSHPAATPVCKHCGAPSAAGEFCCAGCAYVYRLIHEQGLDSYYRIKDEVTNPADPSLLQPRDYGWLATAQAEAEKAAGERTPLLTLSIQGISCAACVWLVEKLFNKEPGAGRIEVNAQTGQLRLSWVRGVFEAAHFARTLQSFNYLIGPAGAAVPEASESRALAKRIGLCTAFAMNVMLFALPTYFGMERTFAYAPLFATLQLVFGTLSLLAGGGYFLKRALRALRERALHIDLPIGLGILGAYTGSFYGWMSGREEFVYFDFVSGFILLMLVGRWAQVVAVERNQRRLLRAQPTPPLVRVLAADGTVRDLAPESLASGDVFEVPMGQTVPVEARLENDEAALSLAWINGEAEPRVFHQRQRVPAGAQNVGRKEIRLVATQGWDRSLLAELLRPVERSDYRHRLLERVIQFYLIAIIGVALLAGVVWASRTGDALETGAIVTAILVVSCPCALGLAFPLADEIATVALRRRGVFVRAGDLWPRLQRVKKLVFDKTGTLTLETPALLNPEQVSNLDVRARAALRALVQDNPHPMSRALLEALLVRGAPEPLDGEPTEVVGQGLGLAGWTLGRAGWADNGLADGSTVLAEGGRVCARFRFADHARTDACVEVRALQSRGLIAFILSGDRREKVETLARELAIPSDHAYGELTPHAKAAWLDENGADDALMLGDGANDSLAFDRALCRGTPVVHRGMLEQKADFYYLGRGIAGIRALFEVNDARRQTQLVLLVFMIAYNLTAVGLAVSGLMSPLFAAVLMPLSSLATLAIVGIGMRAAWKTVAST
ncbi:MAG TPA: heavy metal translocating P-type ATPase metal-binding domain-containing protein [Opitutaceae bacterium]